MKKIFFAAALAGAAMLASCGGNKGGVQMGSLSDFDSLSYALGANVGYGLNYQMKDIPFDYEAMDKGIKEGALGRPSVRRVPARSPRSVPRPTASVLPAAIRPRWSIP